MNVLLFDVDLTLINSGGAGRESMTLAFQKIFGTVNGLDRVDFAGRTDTLIFKDGLAHHGLSWSQQVQDEFKRYYLKNLVEEINIPNPEKHIEPGVPGLLTKLSGRSDCALGLLTGNWHEGARIKLNHFDLLHFFEFGAFGDDAEFRENLPAVAARRFEKKFDLKVSPGQVYVIGDTPRDVACSKPFGAKSVAVATGSYPLSELQAAGPDFVFSDLSNHDQFLEILR